LEKFGHNSIVMNDEMGKGWVSDWLRKHMVKGQDQIGYEISVKNMVNIWSMVRIRLIVTPMLQITLVENYKKYAI
jgi:hypothetical protein